MQAYPYGEVALVLDCQDLDRCADFWSAALGYRRAGGVFGPYLSLVPDAARQGPELLLQRVPEAKAARTGCTSTSGRRTSPPSWTGSRASAPAS